MDNYYSTTDFGFACFLKLAGTDLREVRRVEGTQHKCEFVFRIIKGTEEFNLLREEWDSSEKAAMVKRTLYASKGLRHALKQFYND